MTAKFGGSFANLAAVQAQIAPALAFGSTVGALKVTDNGDETFTVAVAPPSGALFLIK